MSKVTNRLFELSDKKEVIMLWDLCGLTRPWNDPSKDIERKLSLEDGCFWVLETSNKIVGTVMFGYDGHRGNVYYFCIHPHFQGKKIGSTIMKKVEKKLMDMNCPKLNIMVRTTNVKVTGFYKSIGYLKEDTVLLGKRLISDEK